MDIFYKKIVNFRHRRAIPFRDMWTTFIFLWTTFYQQVDSFSITFYKQMDYILAKVDYLSQANKQPLARKWTTFYKKVECFLQLMDYLLQGNEVYLQECGVHFTRKWTFTSKQTDYLS